MAFKKILVALFEFNCHCLRSSYVTQFTVFKNNTKDSRNQFSIFSNKINFEKLDIFLIFKNIWHCLLI